MQLTDCLNTIDWISVRIAIQNTLNSSTNHIRVRHLVNSSSTVITNVCNVITVFPENSFDLKQLINRFQGRVFRII